MLDQSEFGHTILECDGDDLEQLVECLAASTLPFDGEEEAVYQHEQGGIFVYNFFHEREAREVASATHDKLPTLASGLIMWADKHGASFHAL